MSTFSSPLHDQPTPHDHEPQQQPLTAEWMPLDGLLHDLAQVSSHASHPQVACAAGECMLAVGQEQLAHTSYRVSQPHRRLLPGSAVFELADALSYLHKAIGHWQDALRLLAWLAVRDETPEHTRQEVSTLFSLVQEHLRALLALTLRVQTEYGEVWTHASNQAQADVVAAALRRHAQREQEQQKGGPQHG